MKGIAYTGTQQTLSHVPKHKVLYCLLNSATRGGVAIQCSVLRVMLIKHTLRTHIPA